MKKETLERETENELNVHQIAEKYNISVKKVKESAKEHGVEVIIDYTGRLSEQQEEFLFGKILGDGYLTNPKSGNSHLQIGHGAKQKEYVEYCYEFIKEWCNKPPKERSQKRDPKIYKTDTLHKVVLASKCHPEFTRLRRFFYEHGRKVINKDVLNNITPLALAIWYQDDGSVENDYRVKRSNGIKLHTLQFSLEKNKEICEWLWETYNIRANPNKSQKGKDGQQQYCVRISKGSMKDFIEIIRPYVAESMKYKLELMV